MQDQPTTKLSTSQDAQQDSRSGAFSPKESFLMRLLSWMEPKVKLGEYTVQAHFGLTAYFLILISHVFTAPTDSARAADIHRIAVCMILFGSVTLHEFGHVLTARRYGVRTSSIVLYPFGGVATLERMPPPRQELWVVLCGPAVNGVVALASLAVLALWHLPLGRFLDFSDQPSLLAQILWLNVNILLFNLYPMFPMDGGRVLRALLGHRLTELRATEVAWKVALIASGAMAMLGLIAHHWILIAIALMLTPSGLAEVKAKRAEAREAEETKKRGYRLIIVPNTAKRGPK